MKHFIIGTAGHVDHGKTSLIKAMTGIDADRLAEEKKRGITIDLGFAYVDLPHFEKVGIVDVPGHEKFIRNMLAGAGGIDIVMLVVAADEGVMPQTREHLDILRMLNMQQGIVVLTKTDLVDADFLDLVEEDIRDEVKGSFLEDAPILRVSSYTGEGIEALRNALDALLLSLKAKDDKTPFRLPVDRAFTMPGFGTVVTGTVIEGKIQTKDVCYLYPDEIPVKIRGIQVHSQPTEEAFAGQRAAVNLSNIHKEDIRRGHILAPAGSLTPTMMLDVRLDVLADSPFSVKNNSKVHLYHGSAEVLAKVVLMDRETLDPGESCYAQLRLEEAIAARKTDMFVIRFYSPLVTIGGGMILDAVPVKKRRNQEAVCRGMEVKEKGSDKEQLYQAILENSRAAFLTLPQLTLCGSLNKQSVKNDRNALLKEGKIIELAGEVFLTAELEERLRENAVKMLGDFHAQNSLEEGMPVQEFRMRLLGEGRKNDADALLRYWEEKKSVKQRDNLVSLYAFEVVRQEDDLKLMKEIAALYLQAGYALPVLESVSEDFADNRRFKPVLSAMLRDGELVKLDNRYLIHKEYYEKAREKLIEMGREQPEISLGEYRDRLDASRKVALALLECFDRRGVTRKKGDIRVLHRI